MVFTESDPLRVKVDTNVIPSGPGSTYGDPNATEYGPGAADGKIVFPPTALDNTPRTRVQTPPSYPLSLKAGGISGEVLVEFVVDERGRVINPRVLRSTHPDFEAPTLAAVAKWRFVPGTRSMAPVRFKMVVPVKFNLNE
jgi:protein TonB